MRRSSGARIPGDLIKTIFISALPFFGMLHLRYQAPCGQHHGGTENADEKARQQKHGERSCPKGGKGTPVELLAKWLLHGITPLLQGYARAGRLAHRM